MRFDATLCCQLLMFPSLVFRMQQSLDGFVVPTAKSARGSGTLKWSKNGLLDHIVEFVVAGDQVPLFFCASPGP